MKSSLLSLVTALSCHASAHGIVTKIVAGTSTYQGYETNFQYMPTPPAVIGWTAPQTQDRGPVDGTNLQNPDVICQRGATNAKLSAEVAAGDTVSLQWTAWPESHKGPMLDYLADCGGDCTTVDKSTLKFFKIDGVGMTSTSGTPSQYADDIMTTNNNTWSVKIPAGIKAGNYVLRHETIALHQAQGVGGAQLYPQCVNLMITGGGSDTPDGVLGTALYKTTDPGIQFNIYQQFKSTSDYPVPGPPLYSGASSNDPAALNSGLPAVAGSPAGTPTGTTAAPPATKATSTAPQGATATSNAGGMIGDQCKAYMFAMMKRDGLHPRDFVL